MMPTSLSFSVTSSAPTFLSAIIWMAWKTVASGEMDQAEVPLWLRISLIVAFGFITILPYHGQEQTASSFFRELRRRAGRELGVGVRPDSSLSGFPCFFVAVVYGSSIYSLHYELQTHSRIDPPANRPNPAHGPGRRQRHTPGSPWALLQPSVLRRRQERLPLCSGRTGARGGGGYRGLPAFPGVGKAVRPAPSGKNPSRAQGRAKKKDPTPRILLAQDEEIQRLIAQFQSQVAEGEAVAQLEILVRTAVFKSANELVGWLLQQAADRIDAAYQPKPGQVRKGREAIEAQGIFGHFPVTRDYYYHAGKDQGHYPADAALGLEVSYTPALAKLLCLEGADEQTYLKAERHLEQTGGIS